MATSTPYRALTGLFGLASIVVWLVWMLLLPAAALADAPPASTNPGSFSMIGPVAPAANAAQPVTNAGTLAVVGNGAATLAASTSALDAGQWQVATSGQIVVHVYRYTGQAASGSDPSVTATAWNTALTDVLLS